MGSVTVTNLIVLVNIALGNAAPSACAQGIPPDTAVDISFLVKAVNNALTGCPAELSESSSTTLR
jgi:hypothetical protein